MRQREEIIEENEGKEMSNKRVLEVLLDIRDLLNKPQQNPQYDACPPHNMQPFVYTGSWGASVPPPTMRCTKCLMTQ